MRGVAREDLTVRLKLHLKNKKPSLRPVSCLSSKLEELKWIINHSQIKFAQQGEPPAKRKKNSRRKDSKCS